MTREHRRRRRKRTHVRQHHFARSLRRRVRWIVMGALVTSTAFGGRLARPVYAWESSGALLPVPSETAAWAQAEPIRAQGDERRSFNIPPGPLAAVLPALEQAARITVSLSVDSIGLIQSPGVSGIFTVSQALDRLLSGTSVVARFTAPAAVMLEFRLADAVEVTARAPIPIVSPKFTEPLRETPQSIDVIPREVLDAQATMTLRDAVRNVAGISIAAGEGGAQGDNLTIRGFTARSDIFIDGMRDFGSYYRDPFNQEQVQVLKGPASVTFGRGSTGGVLNQASKAPSLTPSFAGTVNTGTDKTRRVTMDMNQPLPELGTGAAFRLNVMAHDSGVAGRDIAENRRFGIAPSLEIGLGTPTRLTLGYFHQSADDTPDYGIPWLFNAPAPVSRNAYYGFKQSNFLRTNADIGSFSLAHDFSPAVSLTSRVRYANYSRDVQITEARVAGAVTPATPLDSIAVTRNQIAVESTETFLQNQTDLSGRFRIGPTSHTLVGGLEAGRETSDPKRLAFTGVPGTSLLNPDENQPFAGTATVSSNTRAAAVSVAAYLLDTVSLGRRLDLTGGVRWDRFDANVAQSVAPATSFNRVDEMVSWRGAVVFKPTSSGSIYFAYGTSFNPSAESLALSATTANTPPEKNETFEIGSKWDVASGRLSVRGAVFDTDKTNAREADPNNPLQNVLSGEQRVVGFEVETSGHVTNRWQMLASYALMDGTLVASKAFPSAIGAQLANVPRHTLSLWNTVTLPWALETGGGLRHVSSRTASSTVPLDPTTGLIKELPGYWTANAMVKRRLTARVDLQLNIDNVTDADYFDQLHPGHIVPGAGRSALLGINFKY